MSSLYNRIRERRLALGMSQAELADSLGYSDRSTIAKIEKGVNDLTQSKIEAFANILQTTPAYLMGWTDDYYDYNKDEDDRFSEIPHEQFEAMKDRHGGDLAAVWNAWIDIQYEALSERYDNSPSAIKNVIPFPESRDRNVIRLVGRDGSVIIKELTDTELSAYKTMVDHLPEADDL